MGQKSPAALLAEFVALASFGGWQKAWFLPAGRPSALGVGTAGNKAPASTLRKAPHGDF